MKNAKRKHKFVFDRGHALHAHRPAAAGDGSVARAVAGVTASRSQTSAGISPLLLDAVKLCNTCDNNSVWFYAKYSISQGIIPVPRRQGFSPRRWPRPTRPGLLCYTAASYYVQLPPISRTYSLPLLLKPI